MTIPFRSTHSHSRADRAGFTLIELMLVLTIIAILMGSAIHFLSGTADEAKTIRVQGDLGAIAAQLQLYEMRSSSLPTSEQGLKSLVEKPTAEPVPDNWRGKLMDEVPKDPWGHFYNYKFPAERSSKPYDLYSSGPDGVPGNADDIGNWKRKE